jgi:hypothetical protein
VRQLEVVSLSDDGTHVLLASDGNADKATHQIRIDDRLVAAVRGDLDPTDRRASELTPKEIQARLRAGDSPDQVAKAARIPLTRVLRYAGPVESERDRIVGQARRTPLTKPRGPVATRAMGDAVDGRLTTMTGFRPDTVRWTARRREDGTWVIELAYSARGHRRASWLWQPTSAELTALDLAAARLAADEPAPRARRKTASARAAGTSTRGGRATPAPQRAATARRRKAERATAVVEPVAKRVNGRAPSWSEVLLGAQSAEEPLTVRRSREVSRPPAATKKTAARTPKRGRR